MKCKCEVKKNISTNINFIGFERNNISSFFDFKTYMNLEVIKCYKTLFIYLIIMICLYIKYKKIEEILYYKYILNISLIKYVLQSRDITSKESIIKKNKLKKIKEKIDNKNKMKKKTKMKDNVHKNTNQRKIA